MGTAIARRSCLSVRQQIFKLLGCCCLQMLEQILQRQAAVDNVLNDEDVLIPEGKFHILGDFHAAGGGGTVAIAAQADEIHPDRHVQESAPDRPER